MINSFADGSSWTDCLPDSEHVRFFKATDWAASALGPLEGWSLALQLNVCQLLSNTHGALIYWGPHRTAIYNEGFIQAADKAHPRLMGSTLQKVFPEIADYIGSLIARAEQTKQAQTIEEIPLWVTRSDFLEETYFTGNFNPLRDNDGSVGGCQYLLYEVTKQKINERRRHMLNLLALPDRQLQTKSIGEHLMSAFATNTRDISLALYYQMDDTSLDSQNKLHLCGSIGIPSGGHPLAVKELDLSSNDGLASHLRAAKSSIVSVPVDDSFTGIAWAGLGEAPSTVSILPLKQGDRHYGFLVIGPNPRRPLDDDHNDFMEDIARFTSSMIAATSSNEDALKRQALLELELAESERKIRFFAQHVQVAMQNLKTDGSTIWANDQFYSLTGVPPAELDGDMSFLSYIYEEDHPKVIDIFSGFADGSRTSLHDVEVRFTKPYTSPTGEVEPSRVLCSAFPYQENGKTVSIMSCMVDVSQLKWAERWQARSAAAARQAKQQQEEFIDAISHEVRNPLSTITQLADGIMSSVDRLRSETVDDLLSLLKENVDDAKVLLHCARHQKRIVDDVLTLSKMDFMLLTLSLEPTQPHALVEDVLRMFEAEAAAFDITIEFSPGDAYAKLQDKQILCDPVRVTQVFINLIGNAIKYTRDREQRRITIKAAATTDNPLTSFDGTHWPADLEIAKLDFPSDHIGSPQPLFLSFMVTDTGAGMPAEQCQRLFRRFEQGGPKTAVKYGGSGLGLFISQKLAQKHGGAVGVRSEPGRGSTFIFFIEARRAVETVPTVDRIKVNGVAPSQEMLHDKDAINLNGSRKRMSDAAEQSRVLLVEDNLVNQRVAKSQLMRAGFLVVTANHGGEALELLMAQQTGQRLDCILMDWEMPVMDGIACTREIRKLQAAGQLDKHIPVIGTTANSRKEQVDLALAAGMDDVLTKPFVIAQLAEKIRRWTEE